MSLNVLIRFSYMTIINLNDIEQAAKSVLSKAVYDFIAGGAEDEVTLVANREVFKKIQILPRVLSARSPLDLRSKFLGMNLDFPIIIAPMALMSLAHSAGEMAVGRAAEKAGIPISVSTMSSYRLEDIAADSRAHKLFQLYIFKDRRLSIKLLEKAENNQYSAIIITVDTPCMGSRERDLRNNFTLPLNLYAANLFEEGAGMLSGAASLREFTDEYFEPNLIWDDIVELKKRCHLPLIIKGILRPMDAQRAYDCGADAVILSNHGGRQLDGLASPLMMLPLVHEVLGNKVPIVCDGGFRRGTDILKALALGASAVTLGRPVLWGLAMNGEEGVGQVFSLIKKEFSTALKLCGYDNIADLKADGSSVISNID
jgi:4-hydroxymandelate oxidase